jgi:hypothetical protein
MFVTQLMKVRTEKHSKTLYGNFTNDPDTLIIRCNLSQEFHAVCLQITQPADFAL